jgi:hypothetical protein
MPMNRRSTQRALSGAFLFSLLLTGEAAAERLRIAAERATKDCPAAPSAPPYGFVTLLPGQAPPAGASGCVVFLPLPDLSESTIQQASTRLAALAGAPGVVVDFSSALETPQPERSQRVPYAAKQLSSAIRSASATAEVFVALSNLPEVPEAEVRALASLLSSDELAPYVDGAFVFADPVSRRAWDLERFSKVWVATSASDDAVGDVLLALKELPGALLVALRSAPDAEPLAEPGWRALVRLQGVLRPDVSRDPTETAATRSDGSRFQVARFYDAKRFTPILVLPRDPAGSVSIELTGGPFARASVENLATGARRDFNLAGSTALTLNLAGGPLVVRLEPAARRDSARGEVSVGAVRGLSAEEIVARERAWEAGQRERLSSFTADLDTSLRFRIAEVNETFDLTIRGPFFFRRGEPADWAWREFYLNGVKWKGKTLPKIPILQPEKVTTLPLDIRLTEDYAYVLAHETNVGERRAYQITYTPKSEVGEKPIYRGTVWIDAETFALLRRESIQLNLKGETLSNIQNEYYKPVPGSPEIVLPLEIRGQQVFSTAGRTTAIERHVTMSAVAVNPLDFDARLADRHASEIQMVRDTEKGLRYLVPDPALPGKRVVEETISKKSTFGIAGAFYDDALDYPIPLLGLQHFNFDLWKKGKQLSVFFGGALLTANYTDPSLSGSRFDLGVDLFAVAFPFGDVSYRAAEEVPEEKIQRLPAVVQINVGRPLGPYLKSSLGIFTRWDNYQRDDETGPRFVTPTDTLTNGAELRLVGNVSGFNATLIAAYNRRQDWEPWGDPATSEWEPSHRDYFKYSLSVSKDQYFRGFRKLHVALSFLGGGDLDRFSKYEFGFFSGNPLRGFKSGSVKTERALVANLSYGLNIEDIIRFEGFYDQAIVKDRISGFNNTYFSGAGLLASLNGPWENSLFRAEVGFPVVSHGIKGFVVNVLLLKLF